MTTSALLVHNPTAGERPVPRAVLEDALSRVGVAPRSVCTKSDDLDAAFATALAEPVDLVVVAGGDGTVAKAMVRLRGPTPPVAILPLGSANNIARSLGIAAPWRDVVGGLRNASARPFRLGLAASPEGEAPFVEAVDVGAVAAGLENAAGAGLDGPAKRAHGRARLAEALRTAAPIRVALAVDDAPAGIVDALFLGVLNAGLTGPDLRLADMEPGSGTFEIVALEAAGRAAFLDWLEAGADAPAPLSRRRARRVTLGLPAGARLRVDDAVSGVEHARTLSLKPRLEPLTVLVPAPRRSP